MILVEKKLLDWLELDLLTCLTMGLKFNSTFFFFFIQDRIYTLLIHETMVHVLQAPHEPNPCPHVTGTYT